MGLGHLNAQCAVSQTPLRIPVISPREKMQFTEGRRRNNRGDIIPIDLISERSSVAADQ